MQLIAPNRESRASNEHKYTAKPVLTPSEARFHACLVSLSQNRCRILCKPQLTDVFDHHDGIGFNKICQKHIDFLICRNDDWMPMMGIELDELLADHTPGRVRDVFVNELFACTGIPLIRIHVREVDQIETLVEKLTLAWQRRWHALKG